MPRDPGAGACRLRLNLTPDVDAPAVARRALRGLPLGRSEDDVLLLASELVTNAVEHAGLDASQEIVLAADCEGGLTHVEIRDAGCGFRRDDARDGHGLHIVAALTQQWGVEQDGATRVWFDLQSY